MIKNIFEKSLLGILNGFLKLDESPAESSTPLEGLSIEIQILPFGNRCQVKIQNQQWIIDDSEQLSDLSLKGKPSDFFKTLFLFFSDNNLNQAPIQIQGDMERALEFMSFIKRNKPDLIEDIARFTGDIPAHYLEKYFHKIKNQTKSLSTHFQQDLKDYLQDESDWLITQNEHKKFCNGVDDLRLALDRLKARVQRVEQQLSQKDLS